MSRTQGFNITSCSFGSTSIEGCRRMQIQERDELVRIAGDDDLWPSLVASTGGGVQWAIEFGSIEAAFAAQTQMFGPPATLTVTAEDATGGTFGLTIALDNAVVSGRDAVLGHNRTTVYRVKGEACSGDGTSTPVTNT